MSTDNIFTNFAERSIDELKRILEKLSKNSPKSFINTKENPVVYENKDTRGEQ